MIHLFLAFIILPKTEGVELEELCLPTVPEFVQQIHINFNFVLSIQINEATKKMTIEFLQKPPLIHEGVENMTKDVLLVMNTCEKIKNLLDDNIFVLVILSWKHGHGWIKNIAFPTKTKPTLQVESNSDE